jgi:hypothetical protein
MKADSLKVKIFVFACLLLFFPSILNALDSRKVKVVQNKEVLDNADLKIIDTFVEEGIAELVEAKDFTIVSTIRDELVNNSNSKRESSKKQYRSQFIKSVSGYVSAAFKSSMSFAPQERFRISVNLLMIIESLQDVQLSSMALDKLIDSNSAVRYWAMKCFTNPEIIKQLNGNPAESALVSQLIKRLDKVVENCNDEMLILITNFASEVRAAGATDMLNKIASLRMRDYEKWQVTDESTDDVVLKALYNKIVLKEGMPETARSFAQLYSYVFQRYAKGNNSGYHRQKLITVMTDIEDKCISRLLGIKQTKAREALEKRDTQEQIAALTAEHNSLLGAPTSEGKLPEKLKFRYLNADGKESSGPKELPPPPQE